MRLLQHAIKAQPMPGAINVQMAIDTANNKSLQAFSEGLTKETQHDKQAVA